MMEYFASVRCGLNRLNIDLKHMIKPLIIIA